jgi:Acyl-CoA dehydrogenase, C-terminal domain
VNDEARAFADSVRAAVGRRGADGWRPGVVDAAPADELGAALAALGWDELAGDAGLALFVGPAAVELGRALVPVAPIDRLLGGALVCGELARSVEGERGARLLPDGGLQPVRLLRVEAQAYGDGLRVARVLEAAEAPALAPAESGLRRAAWLAASVGYLAGLTQAALALATAHAVGREAFGRPLAALDAVQAHLADAATAADGLELLAAEPATAAALAHAGEAAVAACDACHQVCGALGFTLEFGLGRASRRARALRLWADAVLAPA